MRQPMLKSCLQLGFLLTMGHFLNLRILKNCKTDYELRISGTVAIRIFYTIHNNEYYLLHAFKKKTQKTPNQEMKTALDRMKEIV